MKKVIKIRYRKQNEKETAPWQQLNNIDEIVWDGRYDIRVKNHDNSMNLPFLLNENETATLIVEDYSHNGKLQPCRTTVQRISKIDQQSGELQTYYRTYYKTDGKHKWSEWRQSANAAGEAGNENAIIWNSSSHIDTYTTAGIYNISGERTNAADGLPFSNAAPGHTFHARLVVLDSSISGTGQTDDKCITQMLMLSNRTGGDGDVYVRTGHASNKNLLAGGNGWEPWGKLQQNIEVGQVTSLNELTGNGVYNGVYTNGTTLFETFVMIVINNYAIAGATGKVRSVSQFKYALATDGTFSYKTRTGQGNTGIVWGDWVDLGAATTADIQDNCITAQKLSTDVRTKVENPLRPLYIAAGAEYNDSGADKTKTAPWGETVTHKAGHYYLNGLGDITEEQMMSIFIVSYPYYCATNMPDAYRINSGLERRLRTNLRTDNDFPLSYTNNLARICYGNSSIEVLKICKSTLETKNEVDIEYAFHKCEKLKHVIGIIKAIKTNSHTTFSQCANLISIELKNLKENIIYKDSPFISNTSVLYMIQNAMPISAITITLHPDAYARLADDADIVAALEAQPLISLVSA